MTLQERDPHAAEDALLQCLSAYKEVKQLISSPKGCEPQTKNDIENVGTLTIVYSCFFPLVWLWKSAARFSGSKDRIRYVS